MRGRGRWAVFGACTAALALFGGGIATTASHGGTAAKKPIIIGWAFDGKGAMAPFDDPALAAAKIRISHWNSLGGVLGRHIVLQTCNTQGNARATANACALSLI